jgi:hypothetical protein
VERAALSGDGVRLAPAYTEQTQTMEKLAAGAPAHLTQIKVEVTLLGRWFQAQALLQTLQIALEGDRGSFSGNFAKLLAYLQPVPDQG